MNQSPNKLLLVFGAVAQLGEHLLCKQGVVGSIPISSTNSLIGVSNTISKNVFKKTVVPLHVKVSVIAIHRFLNIVKKNTRDVLI